MELNHKKIIAEKFKIINVLADEMIQMNFLTDYHLEKIKHEIGQFYQLLPPFLNPDSDHELIHSKSIIDKISTLLYQLQSETNNNLFFDGKKSVGDSFSADNSFFITPEIKNSLKDILTHTETESRNMMKK